MIGHRQTVEPDSEFRVIQRFDGRGRIYDGDRLLDEVSYALKEMEQVTSDAHAAQQVRPVELQTLCGIITPRSVVQFTAYRGVPLTFELEDGRRFSCAVTRVGDTFCLIKALSSVEG